MTLCRVARQAICRIKARVIQSDRSISTYRFIFTQNGLREYLHSLLQNILWWFLVVGSFGMESGGLGQQAWSTWSRYRRCKWSCEAGLEHGYKMCKSRSLARISNGTRLVVMCYMLFEAAGQ